jgi:hypothetical protein
MKNDILELLEREFKLWGVKFETRITGGNHIELSWRASPYKDERTYIIAKTPSDYFGRMNARADIRRFFKADGLSLKEEKPVAKLQKALSLPKPVDSMPDQIKALRAEVGDLTDLVLGLSDVLTMIRNSITLRSEPEPLSIADTFQDKPKVEIKKSLRSIKAINAVTNDWQTTKVIATTLELTEATTYYKLHYLMRMNKIEMKHSSNTQPAQWRKLQEEQSNVERMFTYPTKAI